MAHRIDHAVLWGFCTLSAFFLGMTFAKDAVLPASGFAFIVVLLLRFVVRKIPDKRFVRRSERLNSIQALLKKWSLQEPDHALQEICSLLPDLLTPEERKYTLLIQRLPEESPVCPNCLLELWRAHRGSDKLIVLATCRADVRTFTFAKELTGPAVRLVDSNALNRRLLKIAAPLPTGGTKKEQRTPFMVCVAQLLCNTRTRQVCLYLIVFYFLYLLTHSVFYLFAVIAFALLLCLSFYVRHRISAE